MNGWKECKIADAPFEIIDGDRGVNYPKQDEFSQNGYCLFLNAKNVTTDGFSFNECYFISKEKDEILRKGKLQRNDIVLTTRGTVGNIGFFNDRIPYENIRLNSGMVIIRPDPKGILPEYTHHLFKYLKSDFDAFATGSAQPQLPIRDLKEIFFLLPSLPEQRAIAGVLSSLDDKIDLLHRQNKTLEGMAEALWRKMFVEEADPGWRKGKLGDYLKIQGGYAFKSIDFKGIGEIGIIKITNISGGLVDIINTQFVNKNIVDNLDRKFKVLTGSILIAMTGAEIGKIGIVEKTEKELWLNQRVGIFNEMREFGNLLGFFALNSEEGQEHILSSATGSAQPNISSTGIEDFEIPIVPDSVLNGFGIAVKPFFDKMCFNLGQIRTLSRLRDSLLPKLMSGEVRVNI